VTNPTALRISAFLVLAAALAAGTAQAQQPSDPYYYPPGAPAIKTTPGNNQVKLTWGAVSGAPSGYVVKRSDSALGPYVLRSTQTGTTYTDTGLTNGQTYYYVVAAVNGTAATHSARAGAIPAAGAAPLFFDGFESLSAWTINSPDAVAKIDAGTGKPLPCLKISQGPAGSTNGVNRTLESARPLTFAAETWTSGGNPPQAMLQIFWSGGYVYATISGGTTLIYHTVAGQQPQIVTLPAASSRLLGFQLSSTGQLSWTVTGLSPIATSVTLPTSNVQVSLYGFVGSSATGNVFWDNARVTSP
jgi:hypothetical protein